MRSPRWASTLKRRGPNLLAGKSGAVPITSFDTSKYDCKFGCTVKDFEPKKHFFNEKDARRADRYSQLAMAGSAKEAVRHCRA